MSTESKTSSQDEGWQAQYTGTPPKPYMVKVSLRFLFLSTAASLLMAFTVGRAARMILLEGFRRALIGPHDSTMRVRPNYDDNCVGVGCEEVSAKSSKKRALPSPVLPEGKEVPRTVYTSKNFDTAASASSSSLHMEAAGRKGWTPVCGTEEGEESCPSAAASKHRQDSADGTEPKKNDTDDEEHLPAGQHLLVDIKNVDAQFLNSEQRLAKAMTDVVAESGLTLLSYHCHTLTPAGVSCVGVLLESHVSFHTWPTDGIITLDLFTCGSQPLVPVVPLIERLFAVPQVASSPGETFAAPEMIWGHKRRGFRPSEGRRDALDSDLGVFTLGSMDLDMKKEILSVETQYQRIDIYDVIRPRFRDILSYRRSTSGDGSYEAMHPELYTPERVVHLDGVMQSTSFGETAYHEALVHPAMFSHEDPKRVAIVGGGEGAVLREVLKHKTVQHVKMIEIDEEMVKVSRKYLPQWSDCSDLVGSAGWCGDDPRAKMHYEDAIKWFMDRFLDTADQHKDERFDVIVMDALDPQDDVEFAGALYSDSDFVGSIFNALTESGVYVMQLGESPIISDAPYQVPGFDENKGRLFKALRDVGFESVHEYHEGHAGLLAPWSFLVAFKDYESRAQWFSNVAEVDLAVHNRMVATHSGLSPLNYFDGATMAGYQFSHKVFETIFCRSSPTPLFCDWLVDVNKRIQSGVDLSAFEVKESQLGDSVGRGLFAKVAMPKGTMVATEKFAECVVAPPTAVDVIWDVFKSVPAAEDVLEPLEAYLDGYGFETDYPGRMEVVVDSSIFMFVNHGCNGSFNYADLHNLDKPDPITEMSVDLDQVEPDFDCFEGVAQDRHMRPGIGDVFSRDIVPGDEILGDYVSFLLKGREFGNQIAQLKAECLGEKIGRVVEYDTDEED